MKPRAVRANAAHLRCGGGTKGDCMWNYNNNLREINNIKLLFLKKNKSTQIIFINYKLIYKSNY